MLAVLLLLATFEDELFGSALLAFIDNDGVLGSILRGSSRAPEVNIAVGHLWLEVAACCIAPYFGRVESKANLADGPTRADMANLQQLGASFVVPRLPKWTDTWWLLNWHGSVL